jgi:serine/threonine-protein kinase RsbW
MSSTDAAPAGEQRSFDACMSALPDVVAFARDFCARQRWPAMVVPRLQLVLEELFTNTVNHGHGGDCAATVRIALEAADGLLSVAYEDEAPPFDPVAAAQTRQNASEPPLNERASGGLGIRLAIGLAHSARYARRDGGNRVLLTIDPGGR